MLVTFLGAPVGGSDAHWVPAGNAGRQSYCWIAGVIALFLGGILTQDAARTGCADTARYTVNCRPFLSLVALRMALATWLTAGRVRERHRWGTARGCGGYAAAAPSAMPDFFARATPSPALPPFLGKGRRIFQGNGSTRSRGGCGCLLTRLSFNAACFAQADNAAQMSTFWALSTSSSEKNVCGSIRNTTLPR
jgi:hypothetical protein